MHWISDHARQTTRQALLARGTSGTGSCVEWAGWGRGNEVEVCCVWTGPSWEAPSARCVGPLATWKIIGGFKPILLCLCVNRLCGLVRQVQPGTS